MSKELLGSLELNRIYQMDCVDGMKLLPENCVDLTVTSPPYDNLRTYNGFHFDFVNVANQLYRVTKEGGVVVWVVGDSTVKGSETLTPFLQAICFKEIGFNVHDTMIFKKDGFAFPQRNVRYLQNFEYMFVLSKGKPTTVNLIKDRKNKKAGSKVSGSERKANGELRGTSGERLGKVYDEYGIRYNIWEIPVGYMKTTKDKFAYKHPAMFPEKLAEDHIISWSNEGDIVFDPFMGSGTTAKMALLNKRKFIGFEISQEYIEIANKRLDNLKLNI